MPNKKMTDLERAEQVRKFYGLDGSAPIVAPGYLPKAQEGETEFERTMQRRLHNLCYTYVSAGPEEARALGEALIPLKPRQQDRWKIDKANVKRVSEVVADPTDLERAEQVRKFYGLDGSAPIVAPGYLPLEKAPQGATKFEVYMRKRLSQRIHSTRTVQVQEAAALEKAGFTMQELPQGRWNIRKDNVKRESEVVADAIDLERAEQVRKFYGLDGSAPIVSPGYLPEAQEGETEFETPMRTRLRSLCYSDLKAGPEEARALGEALIPLKPRLKGGQKIDVDKVELESGAARWKDFGRDRVPALSAAAQGFPPVSSSQYGNSYQGYGYGESWSGAPEVPEHLADLSDTVGFGAASGSGISDGQGGQQAMYDNYPLRESWDEHSADPGVSGTYEPHDEALQPGMDWQMSIPGDGVFTDTQGLSAHFGQGYGSGESWDGVPEVSENFGGLSFASYPQVDPGARFGAESGSGMSYNQGGQQAMYDNYPVGESLEGYSADPGVSGTYGTVSYNAFGTSAALSPPGIPGGDFPPDSFTSSATGSHTQTTGSSRSPASAPAGGRKGKGRAN